MRIANLPIDSVELDLENPRIARMIQMYDPSQLTAEQIALALGSGDTQEGDTYTTFRSLKESIRTNGGIIHAILVNRQADGNHIVIEGNTRLQIYRDFVREGVEGNWTTIPAIVHENLPAREIDAIRLQAHLVGPRPWEPYSKARYLDHLRNSQHLTLDQIVEFCGGRRKQVLDYIAAYQDMEHHYRPQLDSDADFDATRFSAFVEYQRPNVQRAVVRAGFGKDDFARWVMEGLVSPLNTVRQLPRIMVNPEARDAFLEEGAREAIKLLEHEPEDVSLEGATLSQLAYEVARRVSSMPFNEFQRIKAHPESDEYGAVLEAKTQLDELFQLLSDDSDA